MDTNNISHSLANGQVFEFFSEHHQSAMFDYAIFVDGLVRIRDFQTYYEAVTFEGLMGEGSIKDNRIKMKELDITVLIAVFQFRVNVFSTFFGSLDCV
jgi:hypothetical protein